MRNRRAGRLASAGIAIAAVLALSTSPAGAAESGDGLWYFDLGGVQSVHDEGYTGAGVTIAVIDTLVNPGIPTLQGANLEIREPSLCHDRDGAPLPAASTDRAAADHGTNVTALIAGTGAGLPGQTGVRGVAPGARVLYYAVDAPEELGGLTRCNDETGVQGNAPIGEAMLAAVDAGADIISISSGSPYIDTAEEEAIARAVREGVVVVAALPNDASTGASYPASGNGVVAVQAMGEDGRIADTDGAPHRRNDVTVASPGIGILNQGHAESWDEQTIATGTSLATPIVAGFLAVVMEKYPQASGDQIIQSLIHNTGAGDHELEWDDAIGYGVVSLTSMLRADPAAYADENPLLSRDAGARPSWEMIGGSAEPDPDAAPGEEKPPGDAAGEELPGPVLIGAAIAGVLVLAGMVTLIVVLARRPRPGTATTASEPTGDRGESHG